MKRRVILGLVLCLALLLGVCATAQAADDPIKFSMDLSATKFTAPKEITVSIKISNAGEGDMPSPVTLYYPNGKQVEEFGSPTLTVGSSQSWTGTWKVTQAQLDAGKITFKVKYSIYNDSGELVNKTKNYSKAITYTGTVASVEINRTITPTTAKKGQEVTVTYDVVNSGNVDITDVSIKENSSISSKKGTIATVAAGEKQSYTFTVKMGSKDLTSSATITYKVDGKSHSTKKESATIKYGEVKLTASLKSDVKGGAIGTKAKLTLTLNNEGKTDFQNVKVTDAVLGEVFSGETVAAGKTVTLEKEVDIAQTADYMFTVVAQDTAGNDVETSTGRVTVTAVDPTQVITLSLTAEADRSVVYTLPGTVKFKVAVTNDSTVDVTNVTVYASGVQLYSFPSILAGETRDFTRDVSVSMAGQYQFSATVKDQLQVVQTFSSNVVPIGFEQPTPVPTEAPIVTPPQPVYATMPADDGMPGYVTSVQRALGVLKWVFLVLAVVCGVLLAIGFVRKLQAKRESDAAMDHLERGSYRDYSQPAPKDAKPAEPAPEETPADDEDVRISRGGDEDLADLPDLPEDAADVGEGDIMAETLRKLYPRTAPQRLQLTTDDDAEPYAEDEPDESAYAADAPDESAVPHRRRGHDAAADEDAAYAESAAYDQDEALEDVGTYDASAYLDPVAEEAASIADATPIEDAAPIADAPGVTPASSYSRHRRSRRHTDEDAE